MFLIREFGRRYREILAELDALAEDAGAADDLEELNAELEDALLMLSEIRVDEDGWQEELADALEELDALAEDFRGLSGQFDAIDSLAERLQMATRMARDNMTA